jgi:phosphoheptose isomerase
MPLEAMKECHLPYEKILVLWQGSQYKEARWTGIVIINRFATKRKNFSVSISSSGDFPP